MRATLAAVVIAVAIAGGLVVYGNVNERHQRVNEICRIAQKEWEASTYQARVFTEPLDTIPGHDNRGIIARNALLATERQMIIANAGPRPDC